MNPINNTDVNLRPAFDPEMRDIAAYVMDYQPTSEAAYSTARHCLLDALGCAILALQFPECTKLLGPLIPGATVPLGARVPGTSHQLDPVQAAFNIGTMIRWLDFNDTWLAAEWGHPSDNLGGILAVADYVSRARVAQNQLPLRMRDVLTAMIKAYEIQGIMALENSFNRVGLDHVVLVKIASTAVITQLLGGTAPAITTALSLAWVDGQSLRTYRHAPNTGSRKSWAAGDATSRAVRLAMLALQGEGGYPSALSAKTWGFYAVSFQGQAFKLPRTYASYVIENILFKVAYPAEFHAQTAVECAIALHSQIINRLLDIESIVIQTQAPAIRIISKTGPLYNPADRDHCLQYMVAIGLLFGNLTAEHYEDTIAQDPRIELLRAKMQVIENTSFTTDYYDPEKRAIANSLTIYFTDKTATETITIAYPLGHQRRREQGLPLLQKKFFAALQQHFTPVQAERIIDICSDQKRLESMPVNSFIELFVHTPPQAVGTTQ